MTSLRTDLRLSDSVVSIRKRAGDAHLSEPISARKLANEMTPEVVRVGSGEIKAGDVSGTAEVAIASNGGYSFSGALHTKRIFFGDKFTIVATLNHADANGQGVAFRQEGQFESAHLLGDAKTTIPWTIGGDDNWIESNWEALKTAGVSFRLFTAWNVPVVDILRFIFIGGLVSFAFLVGGSSKDGCWMNDDGGNLTYRVPCQGP